VTSPRAVRLAEWDRVVLPDVALSPADRRLVGRLSDEGRIFIRESLGGLEIEAKGWVGAVHLQACAITVFPTLIDPDRDFTGMLDAVHGTRLFRRLAAAGSFSYGAENLFDLVAWVLADACEEVARFGVHADYVPLYEDITTVRGRIDHLALVVRRHGRADRVYCHFDERLRDIAENRWLLRALRLAQRGVRTQTVAHRVRHVAEIWEQLCDDDPAESLQWPALTRQTAHYADALRIARIVCEGAAVNDPLGRGSKGFSFLINMPQLFEEFLALTLKRLVPHGVTVQEQRRDRSVLWLADEGRPYASVRPDVLLSSTRGMTLPVDAKYKDYGSNRVSMSDVYQTAIYALTLGRSANAALRRCLLVYPAKEQHALDRPLRVHVRAQTQAVAEVLVLGISVPQLLRWCRNADDPAAGTYADSVSRFLRAHLSEDASRVA
jgi:5-methylcytosine-specific restriction endonuclease McrBC regulatory subunit McrC